jgi:glycosyltransferase 2 family protein
MRKYLRILGSAILLAVIAWRVDWAHVAAVFERVRAGYFVAAVLLYIALQVASSIRWRLLAQAQGFDGSLLRYVAYYFIGMFFNLALPTSVGGDVVRVWYLASQEGSGAVTGRRLAALVSVLAERVNGVVVLVALACVSALFCPIPLREWIVWTVVAIGTATVLGLASVPAFRAILATVPRLAASPKGAHLRRLADGGWSYCQQPAVLIAATLLSLVVQVGNAVIGYLVGEAIGLPVPALYYGLIVPLVALVALVPLSVNGMGLREAGFVALLAPLGIDAADAVTFGLLMFAVAASVSLCGVGFYLLGRYPRYRPEAPANIAGGQQDPPLAA